MKKKTKNSHDTDKQCTSSEGSNPSLYTKPAEMLLLGASSADPYSTIVLDPRTGVSIWSYKGSELQGAAASSVIPLGKQGDVLLMPIKDRPLLHALAVHNKDRYHAKTVVGAPITSICSNSDGSIIFAGIKTQIFAWLLSSGELLSVVDAFYQNITKIAISNDDSFLFAISNDGSVNSYLVSDLVSIDRDHRVNPIRTWNTHSNNVTDIAITDGYNPRVVTCGLDHIAVVHSMSLDSPLLKVSADRPLTSCAIDSAETRVFLGSDTGNIVQINLYTLSEKDEILVQTSDDKDDRIPVFHGHSVEIKRLAVNSDGTLLASGDLDGKYCIWDIVSRQCLKVSTMRGAISTLQFVPNWVTLSSADYISGWKPALDLQRGVSSGKSISFTSQKKCEPQGEEHWQNLADELAIKLLSDAPKLPVTAAPPPGVVVEETKEEKEKGKLKQIQLAMQEGSVVASSEESDDARIKELLEENKKLKMINAQLYEFAAKELLH